MYNAHELLTFFILLRIAQFFFTKMNPSKELGTMYTEGKEGKVPRSGKGGGTPSPPITESGYYVQLTSNHFQKNIS